MLYFLFAYFLVMSSGVHARNCEPWIVSLLASQTRDEIERAVDTARLKREGFREGHIAGLGTLDGMFRAAEFLRSPGVDPNGTHVEYFSSLIDRHLAVVESGIRSQMGRHNWRLLWDRDMWERLELLEAFKDEARRRRREERVDYSYWSRLHFRLSVLATPGSKRGSLGGESLRKLYRTGDWYSDERLEAAYRQIGDSFLLGDYLDMFPEVLLMPTVERMGIMSFTRAFTTGVHPVGVVGTAVHADGTKVYPDYFFEHDLIHLINVVALEKFRFDGQDRGAGGRVWQGASSTFTMPLETGRMHLRCGSGRWRS